METSFPGFIHRAFILQPSEWRNISVHPFPIQDGWEWPLTHHYLYNMAQYCRGCLAERRVLGLHVAHMCIEQLVELLRMCEERDSADLAVAKAVYYLVDIFDSLIHAQKAPEVCEVLRCAAHFPFAMCAAISVEETSLLFELRLQLCVAQGWLVLDGGWFAAPSCLSLRLCVPTGCCL